jgi:hypothetical protein
MKNLISLFCFVILIGVVPTSAQKSEQVSSSDEIKVKAFYFHATRRCVTCQAVETVSAEVIKEFYTDKVSLEIFNREKDENKALVEKYQISGQTLLIVKGDKIVNLTTEAFLNAKNNPDKFKLKLKSTLDSLL